MSDCCFVISGEHDFAAIMMLYLGSTAYYKVAHIHVGRSIASMNILTELPGVPATPNDSCFSLFVPGRGMVIAELELK